MRISDWSSAVCSSALRAVKPAERRQSLRDKCLHVLFLCDVAPEIGGPPARRSDDRLTGLVVDVRHRGVGTTGHQHFHGGAPDAAATQLGRAARRARAGPVVEISVVVVYYKKKI